MDVIDRLNQLLLDRGVEETAVIEASNIVRKEYGGSEYYVAMRNQRNKDIALKVYMETMDTRRAASASGYTRAHIYSLFKKHKAGKWRTR